jgi:predicted transcriptional regulator
MPLCPARRRRGFRATVQAGIKAADHGDFIEENEMDARIERMLQS